MNDPVMTRLIQQQFDGPLYNRIMSKDARRLRDDVYELALKSTLQTKREDKDAWFDQVKANYDPLHFECAILFDYRNNIYEAILRRTSKKFDDDTKGAELKSNDRQNYTKGTIAEHATRSKNIDWIEVAKFANYYDIWQCCIEFPKANPSIAPNNFHAAIGQFRPMYNLFVDWMFADFNRASLFNIWTIANLYSIDFVKECMELVEDPRKRETAYLMAIIQKEHKILQIEVEDNKDIDEFSRSVILACSNFVDHHEPVDFTKLDQKFQEFIKNHEAFNKVKLS